MRCWHVLVSILLTTTLGCVPSALPGQPPVTPQYHIGPPDVLQITVRPEPGFNRTLTVRPDGKISMDLIGDVLVRGRTVQQIRDEVSQRIANYIVQPDVTVVLTQSNSRNFFVFGEVRSPGIYPLIGDVSALQGLASAGGPTRYASMSSGRIVRPGPEGDHVWRVDFNEISLRGNAATNYPIEPGDVIYVPPNASAQIGYAIQIIFFPIQQILGLGGRFVRGY